MPATRIAMRKIREVLRLRLAAGLSIRQIRDSTKVSLGAIQGLLVRAKELGLSWPLPEELDDIELARLFYPDAQSSPSGRLQSPEWRDVHQEFKRKGVTLRLLWEEYTARYPNHSYSYSRFCDRYQHWREQQKRSMRQHHRAGEKCFVDYCGPTVPITSGNQLRGGAITPITRWIHYSDHELAPLRRSCGGSITAITEWLHMGDH